MLQKQPLLPSCNHPHPCSPAEMIWGQHHPIGTTFPRLLGRRLWSCDYIPIMGCLQKPCAPLPVLAFMSSTGARSFLCPFTSFTCKGCRYGGRKKKTRDGKHEFRTVNNLCYHCVPLVSGDELAHQQTEKRYEISHDHIVWCRKLIKWIWWHVTKSSQLVRKRREWPQLDKQQLLKSHN